MKFSKIAYKTEKYISQKIKKYEIKIERLINLKSTMFDFDIELNNIQINMIDEKQLRYRRIINDIKKFKTWKFEQDCNGGLHLYYIEDFRQNYLDEIREFETRKKKIKVIANEISDTNI